MNSILTTIKKHLIVCLTISIFITALLVKLPLSHLSSTDDPYYHLAQSQAYLAGTSITYPVFSHFTEYPADAWYGYHMGMTPFLYVFSELGYPDGFAASLVYHAVLSALLFGALAWFFQAYFTQVRPVYVSELKRFSLPVTPSVSSGAAGILMILLIITTASPFINRFIFFERPHILMLLLVLLASIASLKKNYVSLFVVSLLAPLSYSMSLFVLIPSIALWLGWIVCDRTFRHFSLISKLTMTSLAGIGIGIALHPQSVGYLINGLAVHAFAIFQSLFWWSNAAYRSIAMPAEMQLQTSTPNLISLAVITSLIALLWYRLRHQNILEKDNASLQFGRIAETGFLSVAVGFSLLAFIINRAIEYSVPFAYVTFVCALTLFAFPVVQNAHKILTARIGEVGDIYRSVLKLVQIIATDKKIKRVFVFSLILYVSAFFIKIHLGYTKTAADETLVQPAAAYLQSSNATGVILFPDFSLYPRFVYNSPTLRYGTGMDSRSIYLFDATLAKSVDDFYFPYKDCPKSGCAVLESTDTAPAFITETGIEYIIVNPSFYLEFEDILGKNPFSEYQYLEKVFAGDSDTDLLIYRVE